MIKWNSTVLTVDDVELYTTGVLILPERQLTGSYVEITSVESSVNITAMQRKDFSN